MILEGIVTTLDALDAVNIAPMGPIVDEAITSIVLRPFRTSQTYQNLKQHPYGVLHVTDDVLLIAQGAIGRIDPLPELFPAEKTAGRVMASCCRWFEFEIAEFDDSQERTNLTARVLHTGRRRDFFGFNRAKHAVLEAAILATRLHLTGVEPVLEEYGRLQVIVDKTGTDAEHEAMDELRQYVESKR